MALTLGMPTRSMRTLVAELSLTATIIVARSGRRVRRVTPGVESSHDVAVGNQIGRLHRVGIRELEFASFRLQIEIDQHRDLDGAGLGEDFVLAEEKVVARREVLDGDSHDAVEMVVDVADAGREFVPKLPFVCRLAGLARIGQGRQRK